MRVTSWDESKCPACGGSSLVETFDRRPARTMYEVATERFNAFVRSPEAARYPGAQVWMPAVFCCFLMFRFDPTRPTSPLVAIEWTTPEESDEMERQRAESEFAGTMGAE